MFTLLHQAAIHNAGINEIQSILASTYEFILVLIPMLIATLFNFNRKLLNIVPQILMFVLSIAAVYGSVTVLLFAWGSLDGGLEIVVLLLVLSFFRIELKNSELKTFYLEISLLSLLGLVWIPFTPVSLLAIALTAFNNRGKLIGINIISKIILLVFSLLLSFHLLNTFMNLLSIGPNEVAGKAGGLLASNYLLVIFTIVTLVFILMLRIRIHKIDNELLFVGSICAFLVALSIYYVVCFGSISFYGFQKSLFIALPVIFVWCVSQLMSMYPDNINNLLVITVSSFALFSIPNNSSREFIFLFSQPLHGSELSSEYGIQSWRSSLIDLINSNPGKPVSCLGSLPIPDDPTYMCDRLAAALQGDESAIQLNWRYATLSGFNHPGIDLIQSKGMNGLLLLYLGDKKSFNSHDSWSEKFILEANKFNDKFYFLTN